MQWITDHKMLTAFIAALVCTFILTVLILRRLIPVLKGKKWGRRFSISAPDGINRKRVPLPWAVFRSSSPWRSPSRYPLFSIRLLRASKRPSKLMLTFLLALFSGVIGMIDDSAKFKKNQNEGLSAPQKFFLQIVLAGAYMYLMKITGNVTTALYIPFVGITVELGISYYILSIILIAGILNSVNLNDGIDGFAAA